MQKCVMHVPELHTSLPASEQPRRWALEQPCRPRRMRGQQSLQAMLGQAGKNPKRRRDDEEAWLEGGQQQAKAFTKPAGDPDLQGRALACFEPFQDAAAHSLRWAGLNGSRGPHGLTTALLLLLLCPRLQSPPPASLLLASLLLARVVPRRAARAARSSARPCSRCGTGQNKSPCRQSRSSMAAGQAAPSPL